MNRFYIPVGILLGSYLLAILAMMAALCTHASPSAIAASLARPEIRYAAGLSLMSATTASILARIVAVPSGYLLARAHFRGKSIVETILDVPIFLPPVVLGICLIILFRTPFGQQLETGFRWLTGFVLQRPLGFTYEIPGIVLAQFMVATAFATRTMRDTFSVISCRPEQVAMTLGCSPYQAFKCVALPQANSGMIAATGLAFARSIGEFGPILVFAGATRMKTEVLPTSVFLELSTGNLEAAAAISILLLLIAGTILIALKQFGKA